MRVVDVFFQQCQTQPAVHALQLLFDDGTARSVSWAELERLMNSTVFRLRAAQPLLKVGDHVATWLPNGLAWILVDLACQSMGWVHVALDSRLPFAMAQHLVQHSQAQLLVTNDPQALMPDQRWPSVPASLLEQAEDNDATKGLSLRADSQLSIDAQAPAQMLYTSGTISHPKGVLLSHDNLLSNARAKLGAAPQHASDVRLNILPFAHAYARTCELSTWILSGSKLCIASDWKSFINWAPMVQPTLVNLVPHLVYRLHEMLEHAGGTLNPLGSRLRLLQVGGAALREDVWRDLAARGWPPLQGYGLTETSPVICSNRAGMQRHDGVGPPVDGVEVQIDNHGLLWTRGRQVMLGYWQQPMATQERMRDGWFCTGDLAEQLEDGSLRIIGRLDDQITLSTGYKVAPLELTRRLACDPWLENVVLVGQDRPFVAALIFPRLERIPSSLFEDGEAKRSLNQEAFKRVILERWRPLTSDLPRSMQVERVAIIDQPLTVANGGLNFKGGIRRSFVERQLYREQVAQLFAE